MENKDRQIFKMVKEGFDNIANKISNVKIESPKVEIYNDSLVLEIKETNMLLKHMIEEDRKDENYEIILKIE